METDADLLFEIALVGDKEWLIVAIGSEVVKLRRYLPGGEKECVVGREILDATRERLQARRNDLNDWGWLDRAAG